MFTILIPIVASMLYGTFGIGSFLMNGILSFFPLLGEILFALWLN